MGNNQNTIQRKSIRLYGFDYSMEGLYFVTTCAQDKICLFGSVINEETVLNEVGKIVFNCWLEILQHYQNVILHEFVIMPNHIHGIIEIDTNVGVEYLRPLQQRPNCKSGTIGAIIRGFKIGVTKQIGHSIWQRNYYDHIIRNDESYQKIIEYISENPKNWQRDDYYK